MYYNKLKFPETDFFLWLIIIVVKTQGERGGAGAGGVYFVFIIAYTRIPKTKSELSKHTHTAGKHT